MLVKTIKGLTATHHYYYLLLRDSNWIIRVERVLKLLFSFSLTTHETKIN